MNSKKQTNKKTTKKRLHNKYEHKKVVTFTKGYIFGFRGF